MFERWIEECAAWWHSVPPEFAYLLTLPIIVGALGLWADRRQRRKAQTPVK